jgi:RNA polymerase sigma factor (sigma-70 family)
MQKFRTGGRERGSSGTPISNVVIKNAPDLAANGVSPSEVKLLLRAAARMALRWCKSRELAEDVAQDAVVRLLAQQTRPRNEPAWMFVVVRRLCNHERLAAMERRAAEDAFRARDGWTGYALDLQLDVGTVLSHLRPRERRVLLLVVYGFPASGIARRLGCKERDVGQLVARARRKARMLLEAGSKESKPAVIKTRSHGSS